MKKKITTIWSVGLTLVLATTMLLFPMPASAGTLSWSSETIPSTSGYRLGTDFDVLDLAVSAGGDIIYTVNSTQLMYRSNNGGETWSQVEIDLNLQGSMVAVAPDDENYIAVSGNLTGTTGTVLISDDAGANWDSLGPITIGSTPHINDLALSAAKSGNHYVAVAADNATIEAQVWYYKIGGVGADWVNATTKLGFAADQTHAGAVAFSPNFASDETMVAVTANATSGGGVKPDEGILFQIYHFDKSKWNASAGFDLYPVEIVGETSDSDVSGLDSASISLSPDYLGSDDDMRLSFVGITTTAGATNADDADGIFRLDEDTVDALKEDKNIHSVAFDGTNLLAGRYDTTGVYRSADPLASSPSVSGSATLKSPGGDGLTVIAWAGATAVAGTSGDECAFAVSENDGKTFNDISLINTTLAVLSDVAVSADGSNVYLISADSTSTGDISLWRYASRWERVLSVQDADDDYIVRTAPDDMDVVYVADKGDTTIYYSTDAGQDKWHTRIFAEDSLDDLAIETDGDVVYAVNAGFVSKSTNSGFTWATKKSSKLSDISMLISLGEDLLLAGSTDGKAAYSKDGNATWSKLSDGMDSGLVQVVADGLDEGDLVVAGMSDYATGGVNHLYRWDWDDEEWDEIEDMATGLNTFGIALEGGVLYSISENTTDNISVLHRSLNPTADDPSWDTVDSADEEFNSAPSALRVSVSDTTVKLWAIDTVGPALFSFKDTLAVAAPTLLAPREGFENLINPISGTTFDVTYSWVRPSKEVTAYDFEIALDSTFNEVAFAGNVVDDGSTVGIVAGPTGATKTVGTTTLSYTVAYMPETTYFWRVRVDAASVGGSDYGPIRSPWSGVRSIKIVEAPVTPPVEVAPTPQITVTIPPAPSVTLPAPVITIPTPEIVLPAPQITLPPTPAPVAPIPGWALYAIIFIGAVLVIALIVLILRTRRPV